VSSKTEHAPGNGPPMTDEMEREVLEGEKRLVEYWRRMRDSRLVNDFKSRLSSFACSGCDVDFEQRYGAFARNVIQAHHKEPIGSRQGGTPTTIHDFDAVCANCHCVMHQREPPLTLEELRDLISRARSTP
jgi:5-methylcytosine-specific restriction enzyme A